MMRTPTPSHEALVPVGRCDVCARVGLLRTRGTRVVCRDQRCDPANSHAACAICQTRETRIRAHLQVPR